MSTIGRRFLAAAAVVACLCLPAAGSATASVAPRDLTFEDRVAAQEAVERVHFAHRVGGEGAFEQVVPRATLERIVRTVLRESAALERYWNAPITAQDLDRETERIFRSSRMPGRLRELVAALGGDGELVREVLARPALSERLLRRRFAEAPPGGDGRSFDAWWAAVAPTLDDATVAAVGSPSSLPEIRGGAAWPAPPAAAGATRSLSHAADAAEGPPVAAPSAPDALTAQTCPPGGLWDNGALASPPDARSYLSGVWTGSLFIVWGGERSAGVTILRYNTGGRYDPATDTWRPTSTLNAPEARSRHTAVWTGSKMIVWGGQGSNGGYLNTGGSYDPATDSWASISTAGAPDARIQHTAVWAEKNGSTPVMVVWGGLKPTPVYLNTGARYNPANDTWQATTTLNAPIGRIQHSAVWTGSKMIVFGGLVPGLQNSGGLYDPFADSWSATSQGANVPAARADHQAVWSGTEMIVWGGSNTLVQPVAGGGRYNPSTDTWAGMATLGGPLRAYGYSAVWTGSRLLIWGGSDGSADTNTGASYDPVGDAWTQFADLDAATARSRHATARTGTEMIVWGGTGLSPQGSPNTPLASGGRYDPAGNAWNAVPFWTDPSYIGAPTGRSGQVFVWTGNQLLVWGGENLGGVEATGGIYDPTLDLWKPTTATGAPSARTLAAAVWSGTEMLVWGGKSAFGDPLGNGSRYNPLLDQWNLLADTGAPVARYGHTAAWSGQGMIVWGGGDGFGDFSTGAIYEPAIDTWNDLATANAPLARDGHTAVMSPAGMIVWGGETFEGTPLQSGGLYVPGANTWDPTGLANVPTARSGHSAVWTGSRMLVWGGAGTASTASGGSYDPVAKTWTTLTGTAGPAPLKNGAAAWTGASLLVWGGSDATSVSSQGSLYHPGSDSWVATAASNAPAAREKHTAVWVGDQLLVWGGVGPGFMNDGGRLVPTDLDGDGDSVCDGDCNDLDPNTAPSLPEICDGRDNNCDGTVDEGNPGGGTACTTQNPGLCAPGVKQCTAGALTCVALVTPVGQDTDADGIDNACDNCPGLASSNTQDQDGDGTGDPCDFTLIAPANGVHYTGKVPPAMFSWGKETWQQFRVELSRTNAPFTPTLFKNKFVTTSTYKFPSKYWNKIRKAALANGGVLYWRVSGRMTGSLTTVPSDQVYTINWSP